MTWAPPPGFPATTPDRLVLFDIDGTLVVTSSLHRRSFFAAFTHFFGKEPPRAWDIYAGRTDRWIVFELARKAGIDEGAVGAVLEPMLRYMVDWYVARAGKERGTVLPGVPAILSAIDERGILRGLVTGNLEAIAKEKLGRMGLDQGFALGGFGSDHEDRARLITIAIERARAGFGFSFDGKNVVYIGDTPRDVLAARQAGCPVAVMRTAVNAHEDFTGAEPDMFVDGRDPMAFVAFIEGR